MKGAGRHAARTFLCALFLGSAQAQFFTPSFQNYQTYAQRTVGYVAATVKPVFVTAAVAQATRPAASPPSYRHALAGSDFAYRGQPTQQRGCSQMATRPADQRQMAELCVQLFRTIEAQPDFRRHNVAAAMAVLVGLSLQVSRDMELGDAESDILLRGLNDLLIDGEVMKGKPADLQAMYESALMTGGLIATLSQQGAETGDAQLTAAARALAMSVLQGFGIGS